MEKSTKKVLVVAGVTITLGTGGFIGYKVIKNKRIRAEQVSRFTEDNNIIRALEEVKDPDMYRKFNKMYHDRLSDFANAKSNRKFNEAGVKLDELMHEINEYLCKHNEEIQQWFVPDENADDKIATFELRIAQFMYDTFDGLDQSDMVKYIIEKSSKCPDDIIKTVTEKDYESIGNKIFSMLIEDFDMEPEFIRQNKLVPLTIKIYLKHSNETLKEVTALLKHYDDEYSNDKIFEEKENDNTEEEKEETNEEEGVTDDEEKNNTKKEKEVREDKKKKDKKNKKNKNKKMTKEETNKAEEEKCEQEQEEDAADTNDEENEEEKNDTKEEKEVVKEETKEEEAVTNDEENKENREEKNDTKEEKEVRKNKKNKKDKRNKKKANKVEKEKCERDQEAVATDDEEKEVHKDRKKNKKRNKNKKMTKDESFKEKDNDENEEGECHNEVSNTTDEENCDDERFDEGLVKDICGVKVDFTDDDEDDEEDEYVEKDNLKKLLFNSMDEDDEDEDVENNVEPEIVECPTEADFEDSPRTAYFDMIEYRKDILNSTTYNIKERFQDFNDSIQILNTKEHYGYYHECLEVIFSILSLDEPEEHTLTRLDTFFKEFDKMVKPVIEKRKKDITTIAR